MYNERGELPGEKESESTNSNTSTKNAQQKKEGLQEKITKNKSDEDEKIKNDQPEKNENDKSPWTLL